MKSLILSALLLLTSCENLQLSPKIILSDAVNVAAAGGIGYLENGKAGLVTNMSAAQIANFRRMRTNAKNPIRDINP